MLQIIDIMFIISYSGFIAREGASKMSYREKFSWLSLIAMVVTYVPYFAVVIAGYLPARPLPDLRQLSLFAALAICISVLGLRRTPARRSMNAIAQSRATRPVPPTMC
jgi:hypothetical protein